MLAIGNNELNDRPTYRKGDRVVRQSDGKVFKLRFGKDANTGREATVLAYIKDGDSSYVVGIGGRLLSGWELEKPRPPGSKRGEITPCKKR